MRTFEPHPFAQFRVNDTMHAAAGRSFTWLTANNNPKENSVSDNVSAVY
jgi:hypothetical protein